MPAFYFSTSAQITRHPIMRRCTVNGQPGFCHSKENGENGMYDCSIDGERTVSGERRHDLWHPSQVVLGARVVTS